MIKLVMTDLDDMLVNSSFGGDGLNDLEMIQTFPNSVAVANAVPEVKAPARYVIGSAADDALAQALEQLASMCH